MHLNTRSSTTAVEIVFHKMVKQNFTLAAYGIFITKRIGLILIIGVVFSTKSKSCGPKAFNVADRGKSDPRCVTKNHCSYSKEAELVGLDKFLLKVQDTYYDLHPQELIFRPGGVSPERLREKFRPYNPDPKNLKRVSDTAKKLLDELRKLGVNTRLLRPREKKAIAQLTHYLERNFGTPFHGDYYGGDFLMGPDLFCWQPICWVGSSDIRYGLANLRMKDLKDVRLVLQKMKFVAQTFSQYMINMRFGIKAGMVRSSEQCIAGLDAFKQRYFQVFLKGERGRWGFLYRLL